MTRSLFFSAACLAAAFAVGCSSDSSDVAPGVKQTQHYEYNVSGRTLMVVPVASDLVDLAKPVTSVSNDSVTISGQIRLRSGVINPAAVMRIAIIDRNGSEVSEIHASLKEGDSPSTFTYRAHFAPIPPKGTSLAITYEDWHPTAEYSAANIGSGGNSQGKSSDANSTIQTGSGKSGSTSSGKGSYGGAPRIGTGTGGIKIGKF